MRPSAPHGEARVGASQPSNASANSAAIPSANSNEPPRCRPTMKRWNNFAAWPPKRRTEVRTMKIRSIRCAGLRGATPEGGWSNELKPDDCVHTLVAVQTEEGLTGMGSVFTSDHLVRGALKLLEPLLLGESALEPERVTEKLHQHTFWQGRGGSVTH